MALAGLVLLSGAAAQAQSSTSSFSHADRNRVQQMLSMVEQDVVDNYYDRSFHGVDIKSRYKKYSEKIDSAPSLSASFRVVAAFLAGLHDSHTYFDPPQRTYDFFYGFRMALIGDRCLVTDVRPGTDAAARLHPGDEIVRLNGYDVNRRDWADLSYSLYALEPQAALRLQLRDPRGAARDVEVRTKFVARPKLVLLYDPWQFLVSDEAAQHRLRQRFFTSDQVAIWKIPTFETNPDFMDQGFKKVKDRSAMVIDLRGNGGGAVPTLQELLGFFVAHKTKICDAVGRKRTETRWVKPHGKTYAGKLVVVIDSGSASASEIFARVVQLEHLGTVVGDTSAGAVMESEMFSHTIDTGALAFFGDAVAVDDLIMADGKSLERVGVTPDVIARPSAADLASGRDTVLARAVALAGGTADPASLAQAFPYLWPPYAESH